MAIYYGNEYTVSDRDGSHWMELDINEFYAYCEENPDYKITIDKSLDNADYIFTVFDPDTL